MSYNEVKTRPNSMWFDGRRCVSLFSNNFTYRRSLYDVWLLKFFLYKILSNDNESIVVICGRKTVCRVQIRRTNFESWLRRRKTKLQDLLHRLCMYTTRCPAPAACRESWITGVVHQWPDTDQTACIIHCSASIQGVLSDTVISGSRLREIGAAHVLWAAQIAFWIPTILYTTCSQCLLDEARLR